MNKEAILQEMEISKAEHQAALDKIQELKKEEAWLLSRRGKFTASEYGKLMGYELDPKYDTQLTKGGTTYAYEKYLECITTERKNITSKSIDHGNEFEIEAAERFTQETGIIVHHFGENQEFIELGEHLGCTPDGLIGSDGGFESKCPNGKTHDHYLNSITDVESFKKTCTSYYWQIMGSMYVTGRKYWYFVSYDPRFQNPEEQILILKIERNETDIEKLKIQLRLGISYKLSLLKKRAKRKPLRII